MGQDRLEPGGRPKNNQLEPVKGDDGIWRLDRIRHRTWNGGYTRSSGSGYTKKECLAEWEKNFEANRSKGVRRNPNRHKFALTDPMSLAFEKFIELTQKRADRGKITQQTCDMYARTIRKSEGPRAKAGTIRLGAEMGNLTIGEAGKPSFLADYLDDIVGIVPGIARLHYVVLLGTFDMLTLAGLFDASPMVPVPKPESGKAHQRALAPRERDQLYELICAKIKTAKYFPVLFLTILGTGIRPGEACALWWEDIFDLEDPAVPRAVMRIGTTAIRPAAGGPAVRQNKRKSGAEGHYYYLTLPEWLTTELRQWKRTCKPDTEGSAVFCSNRKAMVQFMAAEATLSRVRADSPLSWVTFGNLRDTVATHVAGKTGDPRRASAQLGHAEGSSIAVRHYIARDGYIKSVVDNADFLEDLKPAKVGTELEYAAP